MSSRRRRGGALRAIRRVAIAVFAVFAALVGIAAIRIQTHPVAALARAAPARTALMKQREREARAAGRTLRIDQRWVGYGSVSATLRRAILIAEDDKFFSHDGLDWDEIQASARKNLEQRRIVRGGSTVTQQLAKNLFLGDARTLTRKFEEAFLAIRLEQALPKRRIFELYLNLIEWGDGIFGAEAAARRYFGVPASRLTERQAVLLAAVIINPRRFSVLHPTRRIERRVRLIASRMRRRGFLNEEQYAAAIGKPLEPPTRSLSDWLFGGDGAGPGGGAPVFAPDTDLVPLPPVNAPAADSAAPDTTAAWREREPQDAWGTVRTPLAPLPAELRAGEALEIRWEVAPDYIEELELLLSIDDGRHFTLRISPELDPGTRHFRWRVPNLGTDHARIAMRVGRERRTPDMSDGPTGPDAGGGSLGARHTSSRHDETRLVPSASFRIVVNPALPPARFALREGWTWIGGEYEPAATASAALRRPAPDLVAARESETAGPPPRAPFAASPPTRTAWAHAPGAVGARVSAIQLTLPIRFVPLRN